MMSKSNMFFFETHRHIGHIELYKVLIIKGLYIILCVLCDYVFQKKTALNQQNQRHQRFIIFKWRFRKT
jgi:hypothetical protein